MDTRYVGFKSAYDEDTFLLGDLVTAYRLVSEGLVRLLALLSPSPGGVLVATDVLIGAAAALAGWFAVGTRIRDTALRLAAALTLLFMGDLLSLANAIVWRDWNIQDLRSLDPPGTLKLIPDATTSFLSLFRTPEPGLSWIVLLGFLALVGGRDPLAAFGDRRRPLMLVGAATLGFIYPFVSVPVVLIAGVLLLRALRDEQGRARSVGLVLGVAIAGFMAATALSMLAGAKSGAIAVFDSRMPTLTPAAVLGLLIAGGLMAARAPSRLVPVTTALLPFALTNQQVVTGLMVSTRDWERSSSYVLVGFALVALLGTIEGRLHRPAVVRLVAVAGLSTLAFKLVDWQRDVYAAWAAPNLEARSAAALLAEHANDPRVPVILAPAQNVPLVRVLTQDRFDFILDYTRLFVRRIPPFADPPDAATVAFHRERLFEYFARLGRKPDEVRALLEAELDSGGGFLVHFLFGFNDVWAPATDGRALELDAVRARLDGIVTAYATYARRPGVGPAWIVTSEPFAGEPLAEAGGLRLYFQR